VLQGVVLQDQGGNHYLVLELATSLLEEILYFSLGWFSHSGKREKRKKKKKDQIRDKGF